MVVLDTEKRPWWKAVTSRTEFPWLSLAFLWAVLMILVVSYLR